MFFYQLDSTDTIKVKRLKGSFIVANNRFWGHFLPLLLFHHPPPHPLFSHDIHAEQAVPNEKS